MNPLTPIVSCADEDICVPLEEVVTGGFAVVADQVTNCTARIANKTNAIFWSDGTRVGWRTGEVGVEITLDKLQDFGSGLPALMGQNSGGNVGKFDAPAGPDHKVILGHDGGWFEHDYLPPACFEEDQICACDPDWLAGYQYTLQSDGTYKWCLVRFPSADLPEQDPLYFASTATVQVTGTGTQGDPYKHHVKIASATGNIIETQADGVFAACCDTYGDPLSGL